MKNKRNFTVKILYFINNKVKIDEIEICEGTKAIDIIEVYYGDYFEKIKKNNMTISVFGKTVDNYHILKENDRVELCEPALMDAREFRISKVKKSS